MIGTHPTHKKIGPSLLIVAALVFLALALFLGRPASHEPAPSEPPANGSSPQPPG